MSFEIGLQIDGVEPVERELDGVAYRALHKRPAFQVVGEQFREHERELFATEGASGRSGRWKSRKKRRGGRGGGRGGAGGKLLDDQGRLKRSLTTPSGEHVFNFNDERINAIGTSVTYAEAHHEGKGSLPARKLIDPTEEQEDEYGVSVGDWIREGKL